MQGFEGLFLLINVNSLKASIFFHCIEYKGITICFNIIKFLNHTRKYHKKNAVKNLILTANLTSITNITNCGTIQ